MNQVATSIEPLVTISSVEIAELTGKQHSHVLRDIRLVLSRLGLGQHRFAGKYKDVSSRWRPLFNLPRRELYQLLAGYSFDIRAKVVDHWHRVEATSVPVTTHAPEVSRPVLTLVPEVAKPGVQGEPLTMSSLEIAELTGKRHDNVRADIKKMAEELSLKIQEKFEASSGGRRSKAYVMERREVDILLTGYSTAMRAAVIDRWRELEAQAAKPQALALPDFTNPAMAARAWASEFEGRVLALETVKVLDQKIAEDASKVGFYEDVAVAEGCQTMKQVADELGVGRNSLYKYLRKHKVLIEHGKDHNAPYQVQKDAGRFTVVLEPYPHPYTGKTEFSPLTMVTGKGLIFIRELIEKHGRQGLTKD
ncbi:phage regulatory protein/antirepressor Ant [Pseudomonas rossensis]|uniref:phage regulatory protein/antirepressor Ant n=1 Tax=Pseudomonas rossensis TaxID=2305471 RepID=UPI003260CA22